MKNIVNPVLEVAGLDPKEASVYQEILQNGKIAVLNIARNLGLKKGDLYNILRRLENQKLIYPVPGCKRLTYSITDPEIIERAILAKEKNLEEAKGRLFNLFSLYNLNIGKPGMRFAQGKEGIKKIFNETLKSKTEILSYADGDGWIANFPKYLKWYEGERIRRNIKERIILPDTEMTTSYLKSYNTKVTEFKFIPHEEFKFSSEINIFDNKVVYVTMREPFIALLIEDKEIADTQRAIFKLSWNSINNKI
ncbi:MAG: helix-turn-helix domain-containing protein [Patescibacteria group bacterium]